MTENQKNDLFYVCSMIEYVARKTKKDVNMFKLRLVWK